MMSALFHHIGKSAVLPLLCLTISVGSARADQPQVFSLTGSSDAADSVSLDPVDFDEEIAPMQFVGRWVSNDSLVAATPSTCGIGHGSCAGNCQCDGGSGLPGLGQIIARTKPCFSDFISPMTNPVFFEDPRTLTEARAIYIHHAVPSSAGGGELNLYAVQFRAALTDRLSLVASKAWFVTSSHPLIDDGWLDLMTSVKYNLYSDPCSQRLLSVGVGYESPIGSPRTLQANGDGEFHLYATGGMQLGECWHWISGSGFRLPADTDANSQMWYWSNHIDVQVRDN